MKGFVPILNNNLELSNHQESVFIELGVKQDNCKNCECEDGKCIHEKE